MLDRFTLAVVAAKRVREGKFKAFGDLLVKWRKDRDIEEIVRKVREIGVEFDGATLRGWEYGWTGAPDPMRLLAVAHVYGKTSDDVLRALAMARKIALPRDLTRHAGEGISNLPPADEEVADVPASARRRIAQLGDQVANLAGEVAFYKGIVANAQAFAEQTVAALSGEGRPPVSAKRSRRKPT